MQTGEAEVVIRAIHGDVLVLVFVECRHERLKVSLSADFAHVLGREVGVHAGAVPVHIEPERFAVPHDVHTIGLAEAEEDVARHPDFIGGFLGALAEDLEFPLALRHLGVDALEIDVRDWIQTCALPICQWEFQIFGKGSKRAADEMWVARYILNRLCEGYGVDVNYHCKPLGMEVDWNGSGMHANFSTEHMREKGGKPYFEALMAAFDKYKNEHIAVYGPDNHMRLTGLHETQSIDKFNYGIANRGASVRVPHSFVNNGYKGYLEDRRPNSQGDPYKIASRILQTIATVPK